MKRLAAVLSCLLAAACAQLENANDGGAPATPQPAADRRDITYTDVPRRLLLDLYTPAGTPPFPVVVWLHGGSWSSGSKALEPFHPVLDLRARGYAVASVQYRLSGEATFPAQIFDVKAAARWLRGNAAVYGLDPARVGVWGASAGGHLAALLGTSGGIAALEDPAQGHAGQSSRVQVVIDWFGPTDFALAPAGRGPDAPEVRLLGCAPIDCPDKARLASPLSFVDPSDPPFLIQQGGADPIVDPLHSEHLHAALLAAGVRSTYTFFPTEGHFGLAFITPENMRRIESFVDAALVPNR